MLNKLKKNRAGFTLVELVVVIAILGILAAVAVPAYNGYIKRANEATDETKLSAALTAATAAANECDVTLTQVAVNKDGAVTITTSPNASQVPGKVLADSLKTFLNGSASVGTMKSEKYVNGATYTVSTGAWQANSAG